MPSESTDPHQEKEESLHQLFLKAKDDIFQGWRQLSCIWQFTVIFYFIILFPFILYSSVLVCALALLLPFGFIFGQIEHRLTFVWILLLLFMQIGGIADLTTDIAMLGKAISIYLKGRPSNYYYYYYYYSEETGDEKEDKIFLLARLIMTVLGAFPGLMIFRFCTTVLPGIDDHIQKKPVKSNSSGNSSSSTFLILIGAILWKIALIGAKIFIFARILAALIKRKKITQKVKVEIQLIECGLLIDLLCSGIPLGILTALELFYFTENLTLNSDKIWEIVKLSALGVDLIGANFLIYFGIFGIGHKDHSSETQHLLST